LARKQRPANLPHHRAGQHCVLNVRA
jgi:hypothetical protein